MLEQVAIDFESVPIIQNPCAKTDKTTNPVTIAIQALTIFLAPQKIALATFGSIVVVTVVVVVASVVVVGGKSVNASVDVVVVVVTTSISLPISKIQVKP